MEWKNYGEIFKNRTAIHQAKQKNKESLRLY